MLKDRCSSESQSSSDETLVPILLGLVVAEYERDARIGYHINEWVRRWEWREGSYVLCLTHRSFIQGGIALTYPWSRKLEIFRGKFKSAAREVEGDGTIRGGAARIPAHKHSSAVTQHIK